jgi:hypothetical protein
MKANNQTLVTGLNTDCDGNARTIKTNQYKMSLANFMPDNRRDATAVIEISGLNNENTPPYYNIL